MISQFNSFFSKTKSFFLSNTKRILLIGCFAIIVTTLIIITSLNDNASSFLNTNHVFRTQQDYGNNVVNASDPRVNSTLGFDKVLYMNLKTRWDLDDAIILQSAVSDIELEKYNAVPTDDLSKLAMPLSDGPDKLFDSKGVMSCYATHAELWKAMLRSDWQTLLVFEADAVWDVELRRQFAYFSNGIYKLLADLKKIDPSETPTNQDPYLHKHWELIQFGGCFEKDTFQNLSLAYEDPYAQKNQKWVDGTPIKDGHRMIRHRAEQVCSTAYAITRQGAQKLLLRTALDFNGAVDMVFAEMVRDGEIEQYSTTPMHVLQWKYTKQLSVNGKSSEINNLAGEDAKYQGEVKEKAWAKSKEDMSVWSVNGMHKDYELIKGALFSLKDILYN